MRFSEGWIKRGWEDAGDWLRRNWLRLARWVLVLVTAWLLAPAMAKGWDSLFHPEIQRVYDFLCGNVWLSWILLTALLLEGCRGIMRIWRESRGSIVAIALFACCARLIYVWPGGWLRFSIPLGKWGVFTFGLEEALYLLLLGAGLPEAFGCIRRIYVRVKETVSSAGHNGGNASGNDPYAPRMKGLPINAPEYFDDGRKKFAADVAALIRDTDLRNEPFAIGITGGWGTGKSLVLEEMRGCLERDGLDVVEFFPWQSSAPQNLIEDFFKTLSSRLHCRSRRLGNALENYADKLIALDIDKRLNGLAKIGRFIGGGYVSINSAREKVEADLKRLKRSVVVIIDDLDRLDSDELFETLRLVRNTAHFKNLAYIIAYDKNYLTAMLDRKGIRNADRYLEKIFALNIPLPVFEKYSFVEVMKSQLYRKYGSEATDLKILLPAILFYYPTRPNYLLNTLLCNYRQALSLTAFLIARLEILKSEMPGFASDILMEEWYYLQLLSFFYPEVYSLLEHSPETLLDTKNSMSECPYFSLSEKKLQDVYENEGTTEEDMKRISLLMKKLFMRNESHKSAKSIVHERNFYNYFASRILNTEISESEFQQLLKDGTLDIREVLSGWQSRRPSVADSVTSHFRRHSLSDMTSLMAARFTAAILYWYEMTGDNEVLNAIELLTQTRYNKEALDSAELAYRGVMKKLCEESSAPWDRLCRAIMAQTYSPDDPTDSEFDQLTRFLTEEMSEKMIKRIVERAVIEGDIHNVDDISDKDSVTYSILNNSYRETEVTDEESIVRNYAIAPVMECWLELMLNGAKISGKDLDRLADMYGYARTDYQPIDRQKGIASKLGIKRIFESPENLAELIDRYYIGSDEKKEAAREKLGLGKA